MLDRYRQHIDALYVLAYLYSGDRRIAEEAVVDAIASFLAHPVVPDRGPAWLWRLMAANILTQRDSGVFRDTPGAALRMPTASDAQYQSIALVAVGRNQREAAAFLDTTVTHLRSDLRAGLGAFHVALRAAQEEEAETH